MSSNTGASSPHSTSAASLSEALRFRRLEAGKSPGEGDRTARYALAMDSCGLVLVWAHCSPHVLISAADRLAGILQKKRKKFRNIYI
jgi:hypothetical protein